MNYTELINSRFAKENIKIYTNYCMCLVFSWLFVLVVWLGIMAWCFWSFPIRREDIIPTIVLLLLVIAMIICFYLAILNVVKVKKDLKNEDVVFEKIIIEKIKPLYDHRNGGAWEDYLEKRYPEKFILQEKIYFFDHYGNKKKLHIIMSFEKYIKINRKFYEVEVKKEFPVYYLRTSGVILAIMDEDAPSQERLWYKMLNCEI